MKITYGKTTMDEDVSPNKNGWCSIVMLVLGGVDMFSQEPPEVWNTPQWIDYIHHMSSDQNPGWRSSIGNYTTHLYRDYNEPWNKDSY